MDALLLGGLAGGVGLLLIALLIRPPACPACAMRLPRFRRPRDRKQALLGGWACEGCGARVDRAGRLVAE